MEESAECATCTREDCGKRNANEVDIAVQFVRDYHNEVITTTQLDIFMTELGYKHTIIERG